MGFWWESAVSCRNETWINANYSYVPLSKSEVFFSTLKLLHPPCLHFVSANCSSLILCLLITIYSNHTSLQPQPTWSCAAVWRRARLCSDLQFSLLSNITPPALWLNVELQLEQVHVIYEIQFLSLLLEKKQSSFEGQVFDLTTLS